MADSATANISPASSAPDNLSPVNPHLVNLCPAKPEPIDPSLLRQCRMLGVEASFKDNQGVDHPAPAGTLERITSLLKSQTRQIEPVEVVWLTWKEEEASIPVRTQGYPPFVVHLVLENGSVREAFVEDPGGPFAWIHLGMIGAGRHRVEILRQGIAQEVCHVLAAPARPGHLADPDRLREPVKPPPGPVPKGVFLPLHAVRSDTDCGIGDFGDLEKMCRWAARKGIALVGTLPLLASFLEDPCEPSPYSPASRLFWNEIFLDLAAIPEVGHSAEAQAILADPVWQAKREQLRRAHLVEHKQVMVQKRLVLEAALARGFSGHSGRQQAWDEYVAGHPKLQAYARFRAAQAKLGHSWQTWPEPMRSGDLSMIDLKDPVYRYHLAVQFWTQEQMAEVAKAARATSWGLYLDLPLGVNSDSFDVYSNRNLYAMGMSGGAPPDAFFTAGQDWGFPPPHPIAQREDGYAQLFEVLAHHLQFASVLRIDHIMGLHRLWWVPHGVKADEGAYVRYQAKELFAVYCLAAHRSGARMVGEDLGTVPQGIRPAMARHGIRRLHVVQFGLFSNMEQLPEAPEGSVGSLNTHDLPTFAGFWKGLDIEDRLDLGLIDAAEAEQLQSDRARTRERTIELLEQSGGIPRVARPDPLADSVREEVWRALLVHLGQSHAGMAVINIEDTWGETHPQNVPGTWRERPNWRRKAKVPMEVWMEDEGSFWGKGEKGNRGAELGG